MPLARVPQTCRVSESVENIQRQTSTRRKEYFFIFLYNAETTSLRKVSADAKVSEENMGIDSTYMRLGDLAGQVLTKFEHEPRR